MGFGRAAALQRELRRLHQRDLMETKKLGNTDPSDLSTPVPGYSGSHSRSAAHTDARGIDQGLNNRAIISGSGTPKSPP
jgi:hypothetical protein